MTYLFDSGHLRASVGQLAASGRIGKLDIKARKIYVKVTNKPVLVRNYKKKKKKWLYEKLVFLANINGGAGPHGVVANVLNCNVVISEFEFQSDY